MSVNEWWTWWIPVVLTWFEYPNIISRDRLTVEECLEHSWLKNTTDRNGGAKIDVGKLKTYQTQARQVSKCEVKVKDW